MEATGEDKEELLIRLPSKQTDSGTYHEGGKVKWGMVEVGSRMGLGEVFWAA